MRPFIVSFLGAILGSVVGASAADMPARMPVKAIGVAPAVIYQWTGLYVGGHVGVLVGETKWSNPLANDPSFTPNQTADYTSALGGGHVGFNYQVQRWVLGVEADVSKVSVNDGAVADAGNPPIDEFLNTKVSWIASVRGRLGIAFDRWLAFVSGGGAFSNIRLSYSNPPNRLDEAKIRSGWVIGGGAEYAFTENWVGRIEYLYYDFGNKFIVNFGLGTDPESGHPRFHVARIGLSYKFGASPVVARY